MVWRDARRVDHFHPGEHSRRVLFGAIEAIHVVCATYLNPGDEALIPDEDFHIDFEAIEKRISQKTKIVFISSPGNPTGRVVREDEIRSLARRAVKKDLLLVLDEAYHFSKGILVRSGTEFGACGQKHLRICFAAPMEILEMGVDRLKRALDELK